MRWGWFAAGVATGGIVGVVGVYGLAYRRTRALAAKVGTLQRTLEYRGVAIVVEPDGVAYSASATFGGEQHETSGIDQIQALQKMVARIDAAEGE